MFEDPGELGELSIMAKLYDIAAIRLGMGSQWVNLVHQQAAGREENTKLALQKKKDRVKNLKRVANEHGVSAAMAAWCVVLAVMNFHSEWIYDLSKWAMCAGCLFYGRNLWKNGARRVLIPLGILTVVFNPIAPIRFSEDEWKVVDWIGAVAFMGYVPKVILFVIKLPGILWRAFNTGPNDDDDVRIWFAERFLVVFFVIAASVIAYGCWRDSTPEGKLHRAAEEAKWAAQRAERDAAEKARRDLMRPKATESAFHTDNAVIGSYGYRKSNGSVVGPGTAEVDLQDPKNKDWYPGKSFTAPK